MEQVMQCNGEAVLAVVSRWTRQSTEARPVLLWHLNHSHQSGQIHSNLPWPMARAPSTKDGQAQSRGLANVLWRALRGPRVC